MGPITLIHLTDHHGVVFEARNDTDDHDINASALWFQLVKGFRNARPCCKVYGKREITVGPKRLERWLGDNSQWALYHAYTREGDAQDHVFHKFILAKKHSDGDSELHYRGMSREFNWKRTDDVWEELKNISQNIWDDADNEGDVAHIHVGITGFDDDLDISEH